MLKLVRLFTLFIIGLLSAELAFCQSKQMQTVFESNKVDSATGLAETKVYKLKKQAVNADFAYPKLRNMLASIEYGVTLPNLMRIFNPVRGKYNYYQFIATFKGEGYRGIDDFHDILIVKTTEDGKIVDAYHYTLEWAEMPVDVDLYRSSAKNILLEDNLDISQLKFKSRHSSVFTGNELGEKGTIKLK